MARTAIGRYRILRELGRGGMGIVYAARDEQLDRDIAVKTLLQESTPADRERLRREARAAAAITHPAICRLYEIGEDGGELFLVMELLEGESLAGRLDRGPIGPNEAVGLAIAMLDALAAVHARGIVHRDLKPSNIFLTPHGIKLLDFGLARAVSTAAETAMVTLHGAVVGTPRYMAPEQLEGRDVSPATDIFGVGAILFEMLAGRPAFRGDTVASALHAVLHDPTPVLTGSPMIAALDRVVHRALAKSPDDRYPAAAPMIDDLRRIVQTTPPTDHAPVVRAMTRLIVLPYRMLRADPDVEFLAFSLADAVATSLSGLQSLVVRSPLAISTPAADRFDLKQIADTADVDVVLTGTILRAGDQLRVASQLVEAPAGTLLWSYTAHVTMGDVFALQDDLAQRIVESLSLPLSARELRLLHHDVPATAKAYEFYLRANQLAVSSATWAVARDIYQQALEEDPRYAPAWARLARVYRLIAKWGGDADQSRRLVAEADAALTRAIELNPNLPIAHHVRAQLDVDLGHAERAMVRLLERAMVVPDPEIFAGLVLACRYCGLLDASLAAHEQATRLDRNVRTSVVQTLWALGQYDLALPEAEHESFGYIAPIVLLSLGRRDEARRRVDEQLSRPADPRLQRWFVPLRALLDGDFETARAACQPIIDSNLTDSEALYHIARTLSAAGARDRAIELLDRVVDGGFFCTALFESDRWLEGVRGNPGFERMLARAADRQRHAREAFDRAGGSTLLALPKQVS